MTSLLERLDQAEAGTRRRAEDLRAQLTAAEQELERFRITRESLTLLSAKDADHPGVPSAGSVVGAGQNPPSEDAETPVMPAIDDRADHQATQRPKPRGVREQTVVAWAAAERPMRAPRGGAGVGQAIRAPTWRRGGAYPFEAHSRVHINVQSP